MDESVCQNLLEYAQNNANFSALSKMLCAKEKKDDIWFTCCILHNWLLDIDGLDDMWNMYGRFTGHVRNMYSVCMDHVWNILECVLIIVINQRVLLVFYEFSSESGDPHLRLQIVHLTLEI